MGATSPWMHKKRARTVTLLGLGPRAGSCDAAPRAAPRACGCTAQRSKGYAAVRSASATRSRRPISPCRKCAATGRAAGMRAAQESAPPPAVGGCCKCTAAPVTHSDAHRAAAHACIRRGPQHNKCSWTRGAWTSAWRGASSLGAAQRLHATSHTLPSRPSSLASLVAPSRTHRLIAAPPRASMQARRSARDNQSCGRRHSEASAAKF